MFSQSQVIIAFFPEWLNLAFWCVCVFVYVYVFAIPGPALHQGILIVAGSLTEPVRGYSRVFCEFTAHLQYEAQILQMRKWQEYLFFVVAAILD